MLRKTLRLSSAAALSVGILAVAPGTAPASIDASAPSATIQINGNAYLQPDGSATVTWSAQGGCGPYTGVITAAYDWPPGKAGFQVTATSGSMVDPNAARCTNGSLTYTLTLSDSTKATVNASTGRIAWCIG